MWLAPRDKLKLSDFELMYRKPFPQKFHLHLLEMEQLHVCPIGVCPPDVCPPGRRNHESMNFIEYKQVLPAPTNLSHHFKPEDWINKKKTWKTGSPRPTHFLNGTGPLVILTTHSALRLQKMTWWVHHTWMKESQSPNLQETTTGQQPPWLLYESLSDMWNQTVQKGKTQLSKRVT